MRRLGRSGWRSARPQTTVPDQAEAHRGVLLAIRVRRGVGGARPGSVLAQTLRATRPGRGAGGSARADDECIVLLLKDSSLVSVIGTVIELTKRMNDRWFDAGWLIGVAGAA